MDIDLGFVVFLMVAALFAMWSKRPRASEPPMSRQLEMYLLARDRRQRQLSQRRLSDW